MREEQPAAKMSRAPGTPGQQEGDFRLCLSSKASMTFMCLKKPVGQFSLFPTVVAQCRAQHHLPPLPNSSKLLPKRELCPLFTIPEGKDYGE